MDEIMLDLKLFPTTRYQGSKRKILPWIYEIVKELKFESVLDGFGGSAIVSYMFKRMNKTVVYNDYLKFNYFIGKALIENSKVTLSESDIECLMNKSEDIKYQSFIADFFNGVYYLDEENEWLDLVTCNIINMNTYPSKILEYKKTLAYYSLFQACLVKRPFNLFHRKNLYLRTSSVNRRFGNKSTWDTSFQTHLKRHICEANSLVFDNRKKCKSLNQSIFDLNEERYDLVYLDPPYCRIERNDNVNYAKFYHFLEGLSNYNRWSDMIDYDTPTLRLKTELHENYFDKNTINESFEKLINKFKNSIIVISYKEDGYPSIEYIANLLGKFKRNVLTYNRDYKYALNKKNEINNASKEALLIGY